MQIFFFLLVFPFLYFNYKILKSDIKNKIIPNKYLWYLLLLIPFYYIYMSLLIPEFSIMTCLIQFIVTFVVSFILYSFWIWSAGDAKYVLVLGLFLPTIWIIPFIGNVALATLIYLIGYFIYFYFWKVLFNQPFRKKLFKNIHVDVKESINYLTINRNIFWNIINLIITFLIIFVSIRLSRIYIFDSLFHWENTQWNFIQLIIENYSIYIMFSIIGFTFWIIWWIRKIYLYLKNIITKKTNINTLYIKYINLWVVFFLLSLFIIHEYLIHTQKILHSLYIIFTLYLTLYFIFKIIIYSYKITFQLSEQIHININTLQNWDILDKTYLIKLFWEQCSLWAQWNTDGLLYPNPTKYFQDISNPIEKEDCKNLKKIYGIVNQYHKKNNTSNYSEILDIKILKTFAFGGYIFFWFIITYFFGNYFFKQILLFFMEILKKM